MIVKFNVNLGSVDAARLDVDFRTCLVGAEVDISDVAGKWLVSRGIASDVTPPKPEPVVVPVPESLQAVPSDDESLEALTAPEPAKKPKK